jgi:hypothetical protein
VIEVELRSSPCRSKFQFVCCYPTRSTCRDPLPPSRQLGPCWSKSITEPSLDRTQALRHTLTEIIWDRDRVRFGLQSTASGGGILRNTRIQAEAYSDSSLINNDRCK